MPLESELRRPQNARQILARRFWLVHSITRGFTPKSRWVNSVRALGIVAALDGLFVLNLLSFVLILFVAPVLGWSIVLVATNGWAVIVIATSVVVVNRWSLGRNYVKEGLNEAGATIPSRPGRVAWLLYALLQAPWLLLNRHLYAVHFTF